MLDSGLTSCQAAASCRASARPLAERKPRVGQRFRTGRRPRVGRLPDPLPGSNFLPGRGLVHRFRRPDSQKTSIGIELTAFSRALPAADSAKAFFISEKPRSKAHRRSGPSRFEDTPIHFVKKRESTGSISSTFEARRPFEGDPRGRPKSSPQPNRAEGRGKPEGRAEGARPRGASSRRAEPRGPDRGVRQASPGAEPSRASNPRAEPSRIRRAEPKGPGRAAHQTGGRAEGRGKLEDRTEPQAESGEGGAIREPGETIPAPIRP